MEITKVVHGPCRHRCRQAGPGTSDAGAETPGDDHDATTEPPRRRPATRSRLGRRARERHRGPRPGAALRPRDVGRPRDPEPAPGAGLFGGSSASTSTSSTATADATLTEVPDETGGPFLHDHGAGRAVDDQAHRPPGVHRCGTVRGRRLHLSLRPRGQLLAPLRGGGGRELPARVPGGRPGRDGELHLGLPGGLPGAVAARSLRAWPGRPPRVRSSRPPRSPFPGRPATRCTRPTATAPA